MIGKFLAKIAETTLVHLVAGATAKAAEKSFVAAATKYQEHKGKTRPEASTKTDEDFEDLK